MKARAAYALLAILATVAGFEGLARRVRAIVNVARVQTGGSNQGEWAKLRKTAIRRIAPQITESMALWLVAHLARETWYGSAEWNWNVGNIKTGAWQGSRFWLVDSHGGGAWYRAYPTLDAGVSDYLALIQNPHYQPAFRLLVAGQPLAWYSKLLQLGYSGLTLAAVEELSVYHQRVSQLVQQ